MLNSILAGAVSGLVMSTVILGVFVYILYSDRTIYDRLAKSLPRPLTPTLVLLSMLVLIPIGSAIIGMIFGVFYNVAENGRPSGGLGSQNFAFTAGILALSALAGVVVFFTAKHGARLAGLISALLFAGIFGWALPLLANMG